MEYEQAHETAQTAVDAINAFLGKTESEREEAVIMAQVDRCDGQYSGEYSVEYTVSVNGSYFGPSFAFEDEEEFREAYTDHVELVENDFEEADTRLMNPSDALEAGKYGGNLIVK